MVIYWIYLITLKAFKESPSFSYKGSHLRGPWTQVENLTEEGENNFKEWEMQQKS